MKAMVSNMFGAVWFFGVVLPLRVVGQLLRWVLLGWFDSLTGRGYKSRNDLVDAVYKQCVELPAGQTVRLPWINTGKTLTEVLDNSGRLYAYIAVANGWFGLAEKVTGQGSTENRSYRYYYRRDLTGNWFAEIWSVWKSGFLAAVLALPFYKWATEVAAGRNMEGNEHYGLFLLVSGLLLILFFLPRAILGRGTHLVSIGLVNGAGFGSYGCAQLMNWVAGLAGVSYVWMAFGLDWDSSASVMYLLSMGSEVWNGYLSWANNYGWFSMVLQVGFSVFLVPLIGVAFVLVPVAFFWFVSLRFWAVRKARGELEALPYSQSQAQMFEGSNFQYCAGYVAPQITVGGLVYLLALYGYVLYPVTSSISSWFFN